MMKNAVWLLALSAAAQPPAPQPKPASPAKPTPTVMSTGACSPNIVNNSGAITINCPQALPPAARKLIEEFVRLKPATEHRLNELLDKKDQELTARTAEVEKWIKDYRDLEKRLAEDDSKLARFSHGI